ncbi:conserved hypothetical protein (plasmid) [Borreliella valaisiana VS116]|uniref:Uncharacterized protein n=1 Tax=Borreliella valaisiana VS116 TaxID=445987 RepID=C0R942_BORVA|nr:conserved hypothetical protein [Borreliella valaisiana VS116]
MLICFYSNFFLVGLDLEKNLSKNNLDEFILISEHLINSTSTIHQLLGNYYGF